MKKDINVSEDYKKRVHLEYYRNGKLLKVVDDFVHSSNMNLTYYCFGFGQGLFDYMVLDHGRAIIFPCNIPEHGAKDGIIEAKYSNVFNVFHIREVNEYRRIRDKFREEGKEISFDDVKHLGFDFNVIEGKRIES